MVLHPPRPPAFRPPGRRSPSLLRHLPNTLHQTTHAAAISRCRRRQHPRPPQALLQPDSGPRQTIRAMGRIRRELQEKSAQVHRHQDPATRRMGGAHWLHMQQQQQHLSHIRHGAQSVSTLRSLHSEPRRRTVQPLTHCLDQTSRRI
jgi:hypothetical protein